MNLSYECRRGNCISCAAKVQDGEPFLPVTETICGKEASALHHASLSVSLCVSVLFCEGAHRVGRWLGKG